MDSATSSDLVSRKILMHSVIFTAIFTVNALIVGFLTASQTILFDGVYNLVGIALTYVSVVSMKFIKKKDEWNFPFGKAAFEPFIALFQYVIILYICVSNASNAIQVIIAGGREVDVSSGILYGVVTAIYNIAVMAHLKRLSRGLSTAISDVEIDQWKFSCLLSLGILIGFSLSWVLGFTNMAGISAHIDPVLTIVITLIFGKTAVWAIRSCVRELLSGAPSEKMTQLIEERIEKISEANGFPSNRKIRLGKVGNKIIIEIDYLVIPGTHTDSITVQDSLRTEMTEAFKDLPYEKWLNVTFIGDIKHANHHS